MADLKALLEGVGRELQDDFERHTILKLDSVVLSLNSSVGEIFLNALHTDEKIQQGVVKLEEDKLKAFEAIKEYMDALYGILIFVNESTIQTQKELTDVISEEECTRMSEFLGYTILIPVILASISIVGLTGIMGSWKFYTGKDRFDVRRSRRGAVAIMGASALAAAGYTALLIGALLCFMFCFLIAFAAMFVCMGLFMDDDLRLFNAIPNLQYHAKFGRHEVSYSLYDIFYKCKNGYPFFDSLNESHIMAQKELQQMYWDRIFSRHRKNLQKYIFIKKSPKENEIMIIISEVLMLIEKVIPQLARSMQDISIIASTRTRDSYSDSLRRHVALLHNSFLSAFSDILKDVVDISPQCQNLMGIWDGLGGYVCTWITAPAQGLWVACMVCALGSSAIYHALFNTARFLYEYADSTREAHLRKKLRQKKLDYVRRKMGEQQKSPKDDLVDELSNSLPCSTNPTSGDATTPFTTTTTESQEPSAKSSSKATEFGIGSREVISKPDSSKEVASSTEKESR